MSKVLVIDGNAIVHRAFYAMPSFTTKDGFPTNAIYGFFSMLIKSLDNYKPEYLIIAFDTPEPTFRDKIYKEYRTQRPEPKQELKQQFEPIKSGLKHANIGYIEFPGYEADDIIGSLTAKLSKDNKIIVVTGDKDILQLVNENTVVVLPKIGLSKTEEFNPDKVRSLLGVKPEMVADYKAIAGDQSDNYKGASGIGPKTAVELLSQFKTVENLLSNTDQIKNERIRKIIEQNKDNILLGKQLSVIKKDLKLDFSLNKFNTKDINVAGLINFFEQYSMKSLIKRLKSLSIINQQTAKIESKEQQGSLF